MSIDLRRADLSRYTKEAKTTKVQQKGSVSEGICADAQYTTLPVKESIGPVHPKVNLPAECHGLKVYYFRCVG